MMMMFLPTHKRKKKRKLDVRSIKLSYSLKIILHKRIQHITVLHLEVRDLRACVLLTKCKKRSVPSHYDYSI